MEERPISDHWFEEFLKEERLMGSRCRDCGALFVPPRALCIECHGDALQWAEMGGRGKLAAFTSIFIGPPAMVEEGYDRKNPYCTGVVELEESPRVVARIEGVDARNPESIETGTPLEACFLHRGSDADRKTILAFRPAQAGPRRKRPPRSG